MHLEFSAVRLGQLSECLVVPGACLCEQVGCQHSSSRHLLTLSSIDTGRRMNWGGARAPFSRFQSVIDKAGRIDISFNAVGIPNTKIQGVPLFELDVEPFSLPIATSARLTGAGLQRLS
jgi:hypothetical protein